MNGRKLSTTSLITLMLGLKASGLILTVAIAAVVIVSQTHPEIVNVRPWLEGSARGNIGNKPAAAAPIPQKTIEIQTPTISSTPLTMSPAAGQLTVAAALNLSSTATMAPSATATLTMTPSTTPTEMPTGTQTFTPTATFTSAPTLTLTLAPTITVPTLTVAPSIKTTTTPSVTPYPYSVMAYSDSMSTPIKGIGFGELHTIISQPYNVPDQHSDSGHHGVDLGSYDYHGKLIYDWPILSVFGGKVAGIVINRYPIGNCIIIETPYEQLPQPVQKQVEIKAGQSLYVMYCHMINPSTRKIGDSVNVGDEVGRVGKSQTVEAHLHLEMVFGPPNQVVPSMSYYVVEATEDEKKAYLWWRTSGTFISFNPMNIFTDLK